MNSPSYTVAVRALCEFTAKHGDLDLRFTPAPTALQGIEGHQVVAARRGPGYQAELPLCGEFGPLRVRGRADGYDAGRNRLEEVKTFRGRIDRLPENHRALHWAQAMVYGWLLCESKGLPDIELALVYFDVGSQRETVFTQQCTAHQLRQHFEQRCAAFLAWAEHELAHRGARDTALQQLRFPHAGFREGQRPLAEAVYNAARSGRCLMAQAPTGIGKTVGTLFPLLKAAPGQALDRVFFLTAKTSGRALALDAVALMRQADPALPLRTLELVARDKACEHPDKACHGEACPLAKGFYDRLPAAREAALAVPVWDRAAVRSLALAHEVCPYYLTQELARWSDLLVGDYNHYFDSAALLHGLANVQGWRVAVLVDEAHNLVERARAMYSAQLDPGGFALARRGAPAALKRPLGRVQRQWRELSAGLEGDYAVQPLPTTLIEALQQALAAITDHLAEHPTAVDAALQAFYFDALQFTRLAESFDEHSLFDLTRTPRGGCVPCLRNVIPAPFLKPRFQAAHTVTLFSATLHPAGYYRELLGLPEDTAVVDVASPFAAHQLSVQIAGDISTRFQHRGTSLAPVVQRMAAQYAVQPGNYLAFFSSFDYLEQVAELFTASHADVPVWRQSRGMTEEQQAAFLARFAPGGRGIGFAVLGGSFAEGIDLPGDRLIGAFIATLGLPQVNPVNEQIRRRIDQLCGTGFDYTYLYPGLQKVVQAAGRVIRTPQDRGVVHLLDDRFLRPAVQRLLPRWWQAPGCTQRG
ncbi:ATP-dependent DNA helicase [Ideonella sp. BN130291]|uniref:ATP-dependent DNA helicase n=1 Tax=Ideonella sp. BN130291 TaxID=3112940 RepID=UPI002E26746E|nr:ATP-dependent DNA helicase [Ideonella sp. BN130291]